ncbi:MAG: hypothetical protein J4G09_07400 [Proteobacteria bacterium]|nr:hypothetical protein [Pseudomonadota bacterium]
MNRSPSLSVLNPLAESRAESARPAPRLSGLEGRTVGLYSNGKLNADRLLDLVEEELRGRHRLAGVVRGRYQGMRLMKPEEWRDVSRCDAILLTHGD